MQFEARLVHAENGRRVVEASAWEDRICLGRALGEADSAEQAEDRAIERLLHRLSLSAAEPIARAPSAAPPAPQGDPLPEPPADPQASMPASAPAGMAEPPPDPEDWSEELADLELELRRLGWERDQEADYLERAFGHPSRSRLVRYADLQLYLSALRQLTPGSDPATAPLPLRRRDLLAQSDELLQGLGWGAAEGRACLERHFGLGSRQQLSDDQLLQFNMRLEEELLARRGGSDGGP